MSIVNSSEASSSKLNSTAAHAVALILFCVGAYLAGIQVDSQNQTIYITLGAVSGYYTLLACWLAYGTAARRWGICIAFAVLIYLIQVAFFSISDGAFDDAVIVALAIVNVAFLATKYLANRLLTWVSKISLRHRTQLDSTISIRLRYGIGELMLATGLVAVLLAVAQLGKIEINGSFLLYSFFFVLVGFFHFILFWPVLVASLTDHMKWLSVIVALAVFVAMIPIQIYVFTSSLGPNNDALWSILALDLPYALSIAIHLGIANYQGYSLVTQIEKFEFRQDSSNEVFAD